MKFSLFPKDKPIIASEIENKKFFCENCRRTIEYAEALQHINIQHKVITSEEAE